MKSKAVDGIDYSIEFSPESCVDFIRDMRTYKELDHLWAEFELWQECDCISDDDLPVAEEVIRLIKNQKAVIRRRWELRDGAAVVTAKVAAGPVAVAKQSAPLIVPTGPSMQKPAAKKATATTKKKLTVIEVDREAFMARFSKPKPAA